MRTGTFAVSIGERKRRSLHRYGDSWRLQLGRVTVTWMPIEFGDLADAFVNEVDSMETLVEKRTTEVGVWN
jgi:hypothetical protein